MSDSPAGLQRKLGTASELHSVVRTMKAMAAASIGQYRAAVAALDTYSETVQTGLALCLRQDSAASWPGLPAAAAPAAIDAIVFGSDQGMVGQFNDAMRAYVVTTLGAMPGTKVVWPVGERIGAQFADNGLQLAQGFALPMSVKTISTLVGQVLAALAARTGRDAGAQVVVFHHRPGISGGFVPTHQRLLPLDDAWRRAQAAMPWPGKALPELAGSMPATLSAFLNEYLFVSLFRACAESLASENASRLVAMQRAQSNIDQLQEELTRSYHRLRQDGIDEELFDLVAGFEALQRR